MMRNLIALCGLLVTASWSISLQPAQAGDHGSRAVTSDRSDARFSDFVTNSSSRHGGGATLWVTNADSKLSRSRPNSKANEKESTPAAAKDRKKIILFRFDPKFGDISVQPVIGSVNGAQVAVGF